MGETGATIPSRPQRRGGLPAHRTVAVPQELPGVPPRDRARGTEADTTEAPTTEAQIRSTDVHGPGGQSHHGDVGAADAGVVAAGGPGAARSEPTPPRTSRLFGRDLLFVAVLSLPLVSATVVSPVLAHLLPPDQFGTLASAIALHQALVVLAVLGLDQAMILLRAETGSDHTARSIIAIGLVCATVLTGLAFVTEPLWGPAMGFPEVDPILPVVIGWTPLASGVLMASALLMSQDRLAAFASVNVMASIGGQLVGLGVVLIGEQRTAGAYALGNLVTLAAALPVALFLVRPRARALIELPLAGRALRLGLPLVVSNTAVYVLNASDRLVVLKIAGPEEAGRYQIAYVVGNLAVLLLSMVDGAWLTRIAAVREDAPRWLALSLARSGLLRLMTPVIVGITLAAPLVLRFVAPEQFRPAELLVVTFLVALSGFPVLLGVAWSLELMTRKRTRLVAVCAITAAVANVVLNIVLVPVWGIAGAAAATVAAFTVEAVCYWIAVPRGVAVPRIPRRLLVAAVLAVAFSAATLAVPDTLTWELVRFALAAACLPWLLLAWRRAKRTLEQGLAPVAEDAGAPVPS